MKYKDFIHRLITSLDAMPEFDKIVTLLHEEDRLLKRDDEEQAMAAATKRFNKKKQEATTVEEAQDKAVRGRMIRKKKARRTQQTPARAPSLRMSLDITYPTTSHGKPPPYTVGHITHEFKALFPDFSPSRQNEANQAEVFDGFKEASEQDRTHGQWIHGRYSSKPQGVCNIGLRCKWGGRNSATQPLMCLACTTSNSIE